MDKEIDFLKQEIKRLKEELEKRSTKEEMEKFVAEYIFNHVPLI